MWYGCLNSSSVYTTHIPTLRRWISSLSLSKSGSRSIQNYSFTMDPSTSRRPSGVTYRSGFARKESTSALPFSAPASRRTAKLSCFFIPITTFIFFDDVASTRCHTTIAAFVRQIGAQASLLRHVYIGFPTAPLAKDSRHDSGTDTIINF